MPITFTTIAFCTTASSLSEKGENSTSLTDFDSDGLKLSKREKNEQYSQGSMRVDGSFEDSAEESLEAALEYYAQEEKGQFGECLLRPDLVYEDRDRDCPGAERDDPREVREAAMRSRRRREERERERERERHEGRRHRRKEKRSDAESLSQKAVKKARILWNLDKNLGISKKDLYKISLFLEKEIARKSQRRMYKRSATGFPCTIRKALHKEGYIISDLPIERVRHSQTEKKIFYGKDVCVVRNYPTFTTSE